MTSIYHYSSPLGDITLSADEDRLTGLWFDHQKYFAAGLSPDCEEKELPVFDLTRSWLDCYFKGQEPDFSVPLGLTGSPFRRQVWNLLLQIPYGKTITYGQLAVQLAALRGLETMSAQAVGSAVAHNPISILVPCHRVVGSQGSLTGYAGGLDKKMALLRLEKVDLRPFFVPAKGTAL